MLISLLFARLKKKPNARVSQESSIFSSIRFSSFPPIDAFRISGWILTISFISMLFVPATFDKNLYVDGQAYAAISRNLAEGYGSFWAPYFADKFWLDYNPDHTSFFEHPPLMFGIESILFRIFGDHEFVENLYNFLILASLIWLIHKIWQVFFFDNKTLRDNSWLAVLFWFGFRIVSWCAANNLLDTTMTVWCLLSCYFQLKALRSNQNSIQLWIFSGLFILLAVLTKGPVGIYPLALPVLYQATLGQTANKRVAGGLVIMVTSLVVSLGLILLYQPARFGLSKYLTGQVLMALTQERERAAQGFVAHFYLLKILGRDLLPHLICLVALYFSTKITNLHFQLKPHSLRIFLFSFLLAMAGILPMLISVKQVDSYLMPALPFLAISLAAISIENLQMYWIKFPSISIKTFCAFALAFLCVLVLLVNNSRSDELNDVSRSIGKIVPPRSKIYLPQRWAHVSEIYSSLQRYARLSVTHRQSETPYWLLDNAELTALDPTTRRKILHITNLTDNFKLIRMHGTGI